jgi:hypothetical protein
MDSEPIPTGGTQAPATSIAVRGPSPVLITFGAIAVLAFSMLPVLGLAWIFFRTDSFLDLDVANSDLQQFVFNSIGSPNQWISFFQRYLTPAIGALIPLLLIGRGEQAGFPFGAVCILGFAAAGFLAAFLLNIYLANYEYRLFIENAFSFPPASAAKRELFDAKMASGHIYFERLQESMLFIIASICGIKFASR